MWRLIVAFLFLIPAANAADLPQGIGIGETTAGPALVDAQGMTLYTFTQDTNGKSACYGGCAKNWPPLTAPDGAMQSGDFAPVARNDGTRQWAYKGQPLYGWVRDTKPGDATGHGYRDVWHIAKP